MFEYQCIYKRLFGIECPTCGMTRAIKASLHFDFIIAFKYNNMIVFIPVFALLIINALFIKNIVLIKISGRIVILILIIWMLWYVFLSNRVLF